jgi:hypothetical protein
MGFELRRFAGTRGLALIGVAMMMVIAWQSFATESATAVTTHTRHVSCAASSFLPIDSATPYGMAGVYRIRTGTGGSGRFRCDPGIPNGAVVKRVRFTLADQSPNGAITQCALKRQGLQVGTVTTVNEMASVPATGIGSQQPLRLADESISFATIDNSQYAYWLECLVPNLVESNLGIGGADITFTITAAKG